MTDDDLIRIREIVAQNINKTLLTILYSVIALMTANFAGICSGVWIIANERSDIKSRMDQLQRRISYISDDPWTGTMEQFAEGQREKRSTGYIPAQIREIQTEQILSKSAANQSN